MAMKELRVLHEAMGILMACNKFTWLALWISLWWDLSVEGRKLEEKRSGNVVKKPEWFFDGNPIWVGSGVSRIMRAG